MIGTNSNAISGKVNSPNSCSKRLFVLARVVNFCVNTKSSACHLNNLISPVKTRISLFSVVKALNLDEDKIASNHKSSCLRAS